MNSLDDFELKIDAFLSELQTDFNDSSICVGLSGGADSVSLLLALKKISEIKGFKLYALHVNHMIRGEEAYRDEEFCVALCAKYNVILFVEHVDVPKYAALNKLGTEEAARILRYKAFDGCIIKNSIDWLATAHNSDDNAETLIFNIVRGTSLLGLKGISPIRGKYIRPLLNTSRKEICEYLNKLGEVYVTDSTNTDQAYTRNFIRNSVLPMLERINPAVKSNLNRLASQAVIENDYFQKLFTEKCDYNIHPAYIKRKIAFDYSEKYEGCSLEQNRIEAIYKCLNNDRKIEISINGNVSALVGNGEYIFVSTDRKLTEEKLSPIVMKEGWNKFGDLFFYLQKTNQNNNEEKINNCSLLFSLQCDKLFGCIVIRSRKDGDCYKNRGMTKSIKKAMINQKIPRTLRDKIPVFTDEKGIIYCSAIGLADRFYEAANDRTLEYYRVYERNY